MTWPPPLLQFLNSNTGIWKDIDKHSFHLMKQEDAADIVTLNLIQQWKFAFSATCRKYFKQTNKKKPHSLLRKPFSFPFHSIARRCKCRIRYLTGLHNICDWLAKACSKDTYATVNKILHVCWGNSLPMG